MSAVAVAMKTCSRCGCELPATKEYFPALSKARDGLNARCKECHKAAWKAYYAENRDGRLAYLAAYYDEHRDALLAYGAAQSAAYYAAHRDDRLAKSLAFHKRTVVLPFPLPRLGVCSHCGRHRQPKERQFPLHHTAYIAEKPWMFTLELCPSCHKRVHGRRGRWMPFTIDGVTRMHRVFPDMALAARQMREHLGQIEGAR